MPQDSRGNKRRVRLTFTEEVLGSQPGSKEEFDGFFRDRAVAAMVKGGKSEDEAMDAARGEREDISADEALQRGKTVFPRTMDGRPCMYGYQLKGAFKDACSMMRRVPGSKSSKLTAYKKAIDGTLFVNERKVPFDVFGEMGECVRPLRASTPQGDRVALARSETIPAGSTLTFTVTCLDGRLWPTVEEWLNYFGVRGIGQWRNSGKGTCRWEYAD